MRESKVPLSPILSQLLGLVGLCAACHAAREPLYAQESQSRVVAPSASTSINTPLPLASHSAKLLPVELPADIGPVLESAASSEKVWAEGKAMGTHLTFATYTNVKIDRATALAAWQAAVAEFERLEALMTTWREDSEVSRVNAAAGKGAVVVSPETFAVIEESVRMSALSSGAFDITFETLHGLWHFDQDLDPNPPAAKDVQARVRLMGYRHIKLDAAARSVFLDRAGVKISLGGIAKGYAVDQAVKVLEKAGLEAFFVQAGGDLFARGTKPDGSVWTAGVRDPRGPVDKYFAIVPLSFHSFSTAGDYERSYFAGGKRYHHIIDPRTGYPAKASRSVTIWAKTALLADAVDDAVFILGPQKGLELVEQLDGVGAVIVDAQNKVWVSKRLQSAIRFTGAPTDAP